MSGGTIGRTFEKNMVIAIYSINQLATEQLAA